MQTDRFEMLKLAVRNACRIKKQFDSEPRLLSGLASRGDVHYVGKVESGE
jgi:hypothetical protein